MVEVTPNTGGRQGCRERKHTGHPVERGAGASAGCQSLKLYQCDFRLNSNTNGVAMESRTNKSFSNLNKVKGPFWIFLGVNVLNNAGMIFGDLYAFFCPFVDSISLLLLFELDFFYHEIYYSRHTHKHLSYS